MIGGDAGSGHTAKEDAHIVSGHIISAVQFGIFAGRIGLNEAIAAQAVLDVSEIGLIDVAILVKFAGSECRAVQRQACRV